MCKVHISFMNAVVLVEFRVVRVGGRVRFEQLWQLYPALAAVCLRLDVLSEEPPTGFKVLMLQPY